ncbi:MAG: DNA recombination protein RmuC [Proteobacteria bacterium]|nr:DNA recombination protein RmuC [Pseudomonadota bacterium]MBU4259900.1 DNA recombination protein RmuC [Pseudomonadota bacterium]MBU4289209.1 DNA recombination protein RmuC [Pseudomonadota bacterium]MBU4414172.1 DNA recombination protein RmuC [Pseudomonadota bacterium]MCG2758313.1 DNA recombination protein RmuC [Desulfobacteraceae bacterium]
MNSLGYIAFFIIGTAFGFLIAWFFARSKFSKEFLEISKELSSALSRLEQMEALKKALEERAQEINSLNSTITELKEHQAKLETIIDKERIAVKEKIEMLEDIRNNMVDTYKAISASALRENNQTFLDLAKTTLSKYMEVAKSDFNMRSKEVKDIVIPVRDALDRYDQHIQAMERSREKAYGGLSQQVYSLMETQQTLQKETGNLVKALRVPHVRGRWGEITLKRVAELAGMQNRCDFFEQQSAYDENGIMRPDMVVYLPGNRQIVVDAKAPLSAYLEALEAETEEEREILIATHSKHIQSHMHKLAQKAYWKQFTPTPEFVVLFIPGENFFSAALVKNPQLIEEGVNKRVILATPTTLISLLKVVFFGWRQENVSENAKAISELGRELYTRLNLMAEHINKLGRDIERCTGTYNDVIGSFERRVLTSARKFKELGISLPGDKDIVRIEPAEEKARKIDIDGSE